MDAVTTYNLASLFTGENAINLGVVFEQVYSLLPVILPFSLSFIAMRKGISFIFGQVSGA